MDNLLKVSIAKEFSVKERNYFIYRTPIGKGLVLLAFIIAAWVVWTALISRESDPISQIKTFGLLATSCLISVVLVGLCLFKASVPHGWYDVGDTIDREYTLDQTNKLLLVKREGFKTREYQLSKVGVVNDPQLGFFITHGSKAYYIPKSVEADEFKQFLLTNNDVGRD